MDDSETCYGPGSVAGAVIGTFLTTCLLLVVAALLYRQWRRNKGRHLVLVTDPEIVDEAYAFDNPCFKDALTPAGALAAGRNLERPLSSHLESTPVGKDGARWNTLWSNLERSEKRRTLDDSVLDPKASRVCVVGLRSRDFTGLGFNVCGNMREGIFVKDLLHRGPASESGRIHPGDRITSVKISFRSMVYEDALTILSYASPYDVELEVESGGNFNSKPTTLLKKSVGPGPAHICHPLYRSQSIPELSQSSSRKNAASRRLFAADPNDSSYSNYSTMNSTLKSSKSTPGNAQSLERRHHEANHHQHQPKFGIKVLPALDGTVHRVENQNEHNTNLERRHSKKLEFTEKRHSQVTEEPVKTANGNRVSESLQQRSVGSVVPEKKLVTVADGVGVDVPDRAAEVVKEDDGKAAKAVIPSEVPAEVHNAAMAARRNRKSSATELPAQTVQQLSEDSPQQPQQQPPGQETVVDMNESKSPQKGKRKAPAPPSRTASIENKDDQVIQDEKTINSISDYMDPERTSVDSTTEKPVAKEELDKQPETKLNGELKLLQEHSERTTLSNRRTSESDTDSEIQNSFTTIELNPADITVHHTPVPEAAANDDDDDADDVYRKAASLGDLSKYENNASTAALERAQSLDMTDTVSKKRKAPMPPPEDINESTEDLSKLDQIETFDRRKLKKSNEWGTLEDAIWSGPGDEFLQEKVTRSRKKSNGSSGGTLERSKSNVEIKTTEMDEEVSPERLNVSDGAIETSLELYNLPLSKKLTQDFIRAERLFDPDEDNALARIVNDGLVVKSPTAEQVEDEFLKAHPLPEDEKMEPLEEAQKTPEVADSFEKAIRFFDTHTKSSALSSDMKVSLPDAPEELYAGKKEVVEELMTKVTLNFSCPGCDHDHGKHSENCTKKKAEEAEPSFHQTIRVSEADAFETHFAKPILNIPDSSKSDAEDEEDETGYEFGSVTVNSKNNVSNVSVSSGDNSEDSGLVRESIDFKADAPQKMTYITEIKVSPNTNRPDITEDESALSENEEIVSIMESSKKQNPEASSSSSSVTITSNGKLPAGKKPPVPPRRSDATRFVPRTNMDEKQVVYVSEYRSPAKEADGKKFENWVFMKEGGNEKQQEINPWGNGTSQSQPVTNIVVSTSGEEIIRK